MHNRYTYHTFFIRLILCLIAVVCVKTSFAQNRSIYKTAVLYDSLLATTIREFLYNQVTVTNTTSEKISVVLNITPPKGWSSTQKLVTLSLAANETSIVPIRISPQSTASSSWQNVKIEYRLNNSIEAGIDTFRVRLTEFSKFKAVLLNSNMVLPAFQRNISFPVFVKNTGNTPDIYTIGYSNRMLRFDEKISFPLEPNQDTTVTISFKITEGQWSLLKREDVKVLVSNKSGETVNISQNISRMGYMLKENSSAYLDMPLQVEVGGMFQGVKDGQANVQYYGGLHGTLSFNEDNNLSMDFRSNTYSPGQIVNNHIVRAEFSGKHVLALAGNLMEITDFFMDGYGAKLGYKWKEDRNKIQVYSMLKSRIGDNKLFGADLSYAVSPGITGSNIATVYLDKGKNTNGYLLKQSADIKLGDNGKLILNGGAGMEETLGPLAGNANKKLWGSSYGYDLQWSNKWLAIVSNVSNNSNSFPGIYKGQRMQMHDVRALYKRGFIGGYYEYSFRQQNFFAEDSLYSDVFNLKTNNYGARVGWNFNGSNVILSAGQQTQEQPGDNGKNPIYQLSYVNMLLSVSLGDKFYFNTNSYLGKGALNGGGNIETLVNSNQASLQYRFIKQSSIGSSLRYDIGPYYYHEFLSYQKNPANYERIIISPFAELHLFKNNLNIRTQFNYAKTTPNGSEISNVLGNVFYADQLRGFDFSISGILPVKQQNTTPFVNASLRFRLHTPFVPVRKYYQLKLVLFKDLNGNGIQDNGEEPITGQTLAINDNLFTTNEYGVAVFKNIKKGNYRIDFGFSSQIRGWVPVGGTIQNVSLTGNKTIYIPYKQSKILQGKLSLTLDSNSNLSFKLSNIRVTATTGTDSLVTYTTLTDEDGTFYFNLPDGDYLIKLNEAAFDENFRPVQFAQRADLLNNDVKWLYFEIRQKKRGINIRKK